MTTIVFDAIKKNKVLPVIAIPNRECIQSLGEALVSESLPIAEITYRTEHAEEAIKVMAKIKGLLVGAGTIINKKQAESAINAGASFVVSPGLTEEVVEYCISKKIPVFPGVITPSEIQKALLYGLDVLKFFPAESFGGLAAIKAYEGPFGQVKFIPTGGISMMNVLKYLANKNVLACGGSWIAPSDQLSTGNFTQIRQNIQQTVKLVQTFK
jgi:2-dehydro-3-deoxyphosphogluconate aldolase/(4S)-4-hydroxy-2-oxoglutarate aldolase